MSPDQICRARVKTQLTVPDISQAEALCKGTSPNALTHSPVQELAIIRCVHNYTRKPGENRWEFKPLLSHRFRSSNRAACVAWDLIRTVGDSGSKRQAQIWICRAHKAYAHCIGKAKDNQGHKCPSKTIYYALHFQASLKAKLWICKYGFWRWCAESKAIERAHNLTWVSEICRSVYCALLSKTSTSTKSNFFI